MDLVRDLISLGRFAREEAKIKVRQPLYEILIDGKYKETIGDLEDLIKEELNIKRVVFESNLDKFINFEVKPNFKLSGPIFGKNINLFVKYLSNINSEQLNKLENNSEVVININNEEYTINKDMIDIKISAKEGYNAQMDNNKFIILDTNIDNELILEGFAREFVSKIQQLRKSSNFDIADRINIKYNVSSDKFEESLNKYLEFIKNETLALNIHKDNNINGVDININDTIINVIIEKIA